MKFINLNDTMKDATKNMLDCELDEYILSLNILGHLNDPHTIENAYTAFILHKYGCIPNDEESTRILTTGYLDFHIGMYNLSANLFTTISAPELNNEFLQKFMSYLSNLYADEKDGDVYQETAYILMTSEMTNHVYSTLLSILRNNSAAIYGKGLTANMATIVNCADGVVNMATGNKVRIKFPFEHNLKFICDALIKEVKTTFTDFVKKINTEFLEIEDENDPDRLTMEDLAEEFVNIINFSYYLESPKKNSDYNTVTLPSFNSATPNIHKMCVDFVNAYFDAHYEEDDDDEDDEDGFDDSDF